MRTQYTSAAAALTRWLTPRAWRQAHQAHHPKKASPQWALHTLLMTLLLTTWVSGDSQAERFETARAFYVASHQHQRRPGRTLAGFQKALARLPVPVLHALFAAIRGALQAALQLSWWGDGFVVMACDGSRLECPRSAELERRLGRCGKE